jgi:hypothetical protein
MQLAIAEGLLGVNEAGLRHDLGVTVLDFPFRRGAVLVLPFREIGSVKKNDSVRGRVPWRILRACAAWIDDWRDGATWASKRLGLAAIIAAAKKER